MIVIKNLNKYFNKGKRNQVHVINDTSLKLDDNGLIALLGPSGCGKTTLLNTIGGLDKAKSGKIFIDGKQLSSRSAHRVDKMRNLNIGYIFQDYKLVDNLSVYDNVSLVLKMVGIKDKKEIKTRVEFVLEKVDMLRYKNRPAGMLSGGERQRVGIARAIVKDPAIILADEPTGNLDSKNTIEIMNIIKTISKDRLVILVTHERNLAKFYASRIIELQDGAVVTDYINDHNDNLDYVIDNKFYLKDFANKDNFNNKNHNINIYSDKEENINLDIVIKNGNVYIKSNSIEKIEVIDEHSKIELLDEHYKQMDQSDLAKYEFNFREVINNNIKKRYSGILNPFTLLIKGFQKVFDFSVIKKLLLVGFVISGMFIMYAFSSIAATLHVEDSDFVDTNKNYSIISLNNIGVEDYLSYETYNGVGYLLPGNSQVSFNLKYDEYYQTSSIPDTLSGSLSGASLISAKDIVSGKMPENNYEIVVDKTILQKLIDDDTMHFAKMAGITDVDKFLGKVVTITNLNNFTIVGICDLQSPSIYVAEGMMINILYNSTSSPYMGGVMYSEVVDLSMAENTYVDYSLVTDKIEIKKGRLPENDYEVMVNISNKDAMPLNKKIDAKINDTKLTVVGYYDSQDPLTYYLVNSNTIKYALIKKSTDITVYGPDKVTAIESFRAAGLNINDSYEKGRDNYMKSKRDSMIASLTVSGIIILISLIEIFLMTRSSFLSRIKEVGIYRAIGVKKSDIYKMFTGEIIAITTLTSVPGILFAAYILKVLSGIEFLSNYFIINLQMILVSIVFIYLFNLVVGLIPVFTTMRKTPAAIMARTDLE